LWLTLHLMNSDDGLKIIPNSLNNLSSLYSIEPYSPDIRKWEK
jgi:hypothetical protein